jgi:hypothetical protein
VLVAEPIEIDTLTEVAWKQRSTGRDEFEEAVPGTVRAAEAIWEATALAGRCLQRTSDGL